MKKYEKQALENQSSREASYFLTINFKMSALLLDQLNERDELVNAIQLKNRQGGLSNAFSLF